MKNAQKNNLPTDSPLSNIYKYYLLFCKIFSLYFVEKMIKKWLYICKTDVKSDV